MGCPWLKWIRIFLFWPQWLVSGEFKPVHSKQNQDFTVFMTHGYCLSSGFYGAKIQGLDSYYKENHPEDPNKHYEEEEKREGTWKHQWAPNQMYIEASPVFCTTLYMWVQTNKETTTKKQYLPMYLPFLFIY